MTKRWLRGILLGVSLALFLAGGVAMAQNLSLTVDKECVECWPGPGEPTDEYIVYLTYDGFENGVTYCENVFLNGESLNAGPVCYVPIMIPPQPHTMPIFAMPCDVDNGIDETVVSALGSKVQLEAIEDYYGEWKYVAWEQGTDNIAAVSWLLAEVCEEEFVPEPATMVLLGSGLTGLAGYATLRLRSRQTLH